jgi:hypothetical protein
MAKKPLSDTTITPSTPWILEYLEGQHVEWKRDPATKDPRLGVFEVDANNAEVETIETIPQPDKERI